RPRVRCPPPRPRTPPSTSGSSRSPGWPTGRAGTGWSSSPVRRRRSCRSTTGSWTAARPRPPPGSTVPRRGGRLAHGLATLATLGCVAGGAPGAAELRHYLFVNRDREVLHERAFLDTPALAGAQVKYTWRELEPARGRYDLRRVLEDLAFLERHGKRLVLQLPDASFDERINTPDYLTKDPPFHGAMPRHGV